LKDTGRSNKRKKRFVWLAKHWVKMKGWKMDGKHDGSIDYEKALGDLSFYLRDEIMGRNHKDDCFKCPTCMSIVIFGIKCQCTKSVPGHLITPSECLFCFVEMGSDSLLKFSHYKIHEAKIQKTFSNSMMRDFRAN
jgi:hypothetical protein